MQRLVCGLPCFSLGNKQHARTKKGVEILFWDVFALKKVGDSALRTCCLRHDAFLPEPGEGDVPRQRHPVHLRQLSGLWRRKVGSVRFCCDARSVFFFTAVSKRKTKKTGGFMRHGSVVIHGQQPQRVLKKKKSSNSGEYLRQLRTIPLRQLSTGVLYLC